MKRENLSISVIIPHCNSIGLLPQLLNSIPDNPQVEIILVDNSPEPISKDIVGVNKDYHLLYSSPERGAGGARNEGLKAASGKWLLFADADDFFSPVAFEFYLSKTEDDADIIHTCPEGMYLDTGEIASRGEVYSQMVKGFLKGEVNEKELRFGFSVPWCKMIRRELVESHNIRFDEIIAGNDIYFSLVCGYYARKIEAFDIVTYVVTVSRGTLTKRRDYRAIKARLFSKLHCNQFLRKNGCSRYQHSIMFAFVEARRYGIRQFLEFLRMVIKFRQNPFIGWKNWFSPQIHKKYFDP